MAVRKRKNLRYNIFNPDQLKGIYQAPIVSDTRAPATTDLSDIGTIWIDKSTDNAYVLTSITANVANWENFTDEVPATGTNGQVWIGATGADAAWANLTSTGLSVTITNTANGINLEAAGVAALTSLDGDSGTATPTAGVIIIAGGTNVTTVGAAGTLTINLDASPSVAGSLTATTSITAGVDFTMSTGTFVVESDDNAGDDIFLHADGGVSETIHLHSDQGTGTGSIHLESDVGGITIEAGLSAANSIIIDASAAGGGIDVDAGTGGINVTATNGAIALVSGTGAITIGTDATAHAVTIGSTTTTASVTIQSGTGDVTVTSTDDITLDAAGKVELNSSGDTIGIGNDADAFAINVGTGGAARTITIGNGTAATAVDINCGTGDITLGANATAHTTTLGSTNSTCNAIVQSGTGGIQVTSGGVYAMDATDAVTIESSAGTIGIGVDAVAQNINVGIGAAARVITIGNATAATSVVLNAGTGAVDIGANAIAHATTIGSVTGAAATTLQAGTGALIVNGGGVLTIDSADALTIESSAGTIGMGVDAVAQNINIGTGAAARTITIGNATDATSVVVNGGTGACSFGSNATAHATTIGSVTDASATTLQAGTGALTVDGLGIIDIDAAGAIGINSDGAAINIGTDADAFALNLGTGAAAKAVALGSTNTTSATTIQAGSGGIVLTPALGIMTAAPLEASVAGVSLTASANLASCTFTGQTTASAAEQVFTITNTICTTTSMLFVTASNLGANDAQMTVTRVEPKAGSIEVTLSNEGAAALNGNVVINFWLIKAS